MFDRTALCRALPMLLGSQAARRPIRLTEEADTLASLVRSLSAVSLTFIIMVTPWAILQAGQARLRQFQHCKFTDSSQLALYVGCTLHTAH